MRPSSLPAAIALAAALAALPATALQGTALKDLMPKGMVVGVVVNQRQFEGADAAAADLITKQFNQISPENALKVRPTQPAADRYTFEAADHYVQFGVDHHMQVVGHNLVWHSQTGAWVFQGPDGKPADRDTLLARMRDHIRTVVGTCKHASCGSMAFVASDSYALLRAASFYRPGFALVSTSASPPT